MTTAFETTHAGFRILGLSSTDLDLRCAPGLGGRVYSLIGRRTGREWLWRQAGDLELFQPADPRDFGTGTFAGLDECLPTIGACAWPDGRALADHGAIWAGPWQVDEHDDRTLALSVELPELGLRLARRIAVKDNVVRFEYELENVGAVAVPVLWAMHPLFRLAEGDSLKLSSPPAEKPDSPPMALPASAPRGWLDALELAGRRDRFIKCFARAEPADRPWALLANPATGDALEVQWDATAAPYLGLWLTWGGYRGWHHLALEPTNAPYDRVDVAAADPRCRSAIMLSAGSRRKWWVEWRLL